VFGSLYNADRQLTGILFYVPRLRFVKVEAPAKEVPVAAWLRFSPGMDTRHRVRVRGVVEYTRAAIFLFRSKTRVHAFYRHNPPSLAIGDLVDVLGFPAMGGSIADLGERSLSSLGPPQGSCSGEARIREALGTICLFVPRKATGIQLWH